MRRYFTIVSVLIVLLNGVIAAFYPPVLWSMVVFTPLLMLGFYDLLQKKHAVLRNFPLIGHFRYIADVRYTLNLILDHRALDKPDWT